MVARMALFHNPFRRLALGRDSLYLVKQKSTKFVSTKYNNSNDFLYLYSVFQHSVRNPAAANYYLSCGGYVSVNLDINCAVKISNYLDSLLQTINSLVSSG